MQKALRSNNFLFAAFFCFQFIGLAVKSQQDTIFPRKGTKFAAIINEISEETISYKKDGVSKKISISAVSKLILKNGETQIFDPPNEDLVKKKEDVLRAQMEVMAVQIGHDYVNCAITNLISSSPSIDWYLSGRDYFNPELIVISVKVFYERTDLLENEWVIFEIRLDEENNKKTCIFKNSSNKNHELAFLKCQKKVVKDVH